jgi:hypothetical protein
MCRCGHSEEHHMTHPSGRWPCRHYGCGCADFERALVGKCRPEGLDTRVRFQGAITRRVDE